MSQTPTETEKEKQPTVFKLPARGSPEYRRMVEEFRRRYRLSAQAYLELRKQRS